MMIYTRTKAGIETTATTPYLSLINWFCDQIEATRQDCNRYDPINCGRTPCEFGVMLVALIERQLGLLVDEDIVSFMNESQPDQSRYAEEMDAAFLGVLRFLHLHGEFVDMKIQPSEV